MPKNVKTDAKKKKKSTVTNSGKLKKLNNQITNLRGKWGFFYEFEINDILDAVEKISKKDRKIDFSKKWFFWKRGDGVASQIFFWIF